jgi:hypothetical protein
METILLLVNCCGICGARECENPSLFRLRKGVLHLHSTQPSIAPEHTQCIEGRHWSFLFSEHPGGAATVRCCCCRCSNQHSTQNPIGLVQITTEIHKRRRQKLGHCIPFSNLQNKNVIWRERKQSSWPSQWFVMNALSVHMDLDGRCIEACLQKRAFGSDPLSEDLPRASAKYDTHTKMWTGCTGKTSALCESFEPLAEFVRCTNQSI